MQEMTPPVQENFFAVGHDYWLKVVSTKPAQKIKYIAPYQLACGRIDHIFAYELKMDGRTFCHCTTLPDSAVRLFVRDEP